VGPDADEANCWPASRRSQPSAASRITRRQVHPRNRPPRRAARPTLVIRTTLSDPDTLCCTFEDSGPGIKPEHLDHLFDSFFTTKEAGMGLGLPISRSIVEAHGGYIRADNESAYGGARFSFTLPAKLD
jgi:signal transduction histidine kinase